MRIKTLIHTALVAEAKPIIGYFGLVCKAKIPFNLYVSEDIALIVSGMGEIKTKEALAWALDLFEPQRIINIGIAGCSDTNIPKGTLFCTTHHDLDIPFGSLSTHETPIDNPLHVSTLLVDMEAKAFLQSIPQGVQSFIFKVVSDHLESTIPSKAGVGNWLNKSIKVWEKYARF